MKVSLFDFNDGSIDAGKAGDEGLALRLVLTGMLHQIDNLRDGALAKRLRSAYTYHSLLVDATRDDLITNGDFTRQRLTSQSDGIKRGGALDDDTVYRHFLAWLDNDDGADGNLRGTHRYEFLAIGFLLLAYCQWPAANSLHMRHIRTDIHEMGNAVTALALGIALEEFTHLEEEHDEDRLRKLTLGSWEETDAEGTDGGDGHQQMLVERLAVEEALDGLLQSAYTNEQIGN